MEKKKKTLERLAREARILGFSYQEQIDFLKEKAAGTFDEEIPSYKVVFGKDIFGRKTIQGVIFKIQGCEIFISAAYGSETTALYASEYARETLVRNIPCGLGDKKLWKFISKNIKDINVVLEHLGLMAFDDRQLWTSTKDRKTTYCLILPLSRKVHYGYYKDEYAYRPVLLLNKK